MRLTESIWVHSSDTVEQYLIFAESQAERRIPMTMEDWIKKLEGFLTLNEREILQGAGRISAEMARQHAEIEFSKYRVIEDKRYESDFDNIVKQLSEKTADGGT